MMPIRVKACDLQLADTIDLGFSPWGWAIAKQIKDGAVHLFRPYGTTADFSCTDGVICYTGVEVIKIPLDHYNEYLVVERKELK